jgi:squalene-associated FAD-dependent desaturase
MRIAVVGGGWAGLAAAVEATSLGHEVSLFEMSPGWGGRARRIEALAGHDAGFALDNGQHILIGAYTEALRLMRMVGVDVEAALQRMPLTLVDVRGHGVRLPQGTPLVAFARGVLAAQGWSVGERLALLRTAVRWRLGGFRCEASLTVAQLTASLPERLRASFIDPLCVAALNTPASAASAQVFLRVLHDALFAGPGSADLLLPRVDLGALWPDAACRWLQARGARLASHRRVGAVERADSAESAQWSVAASGGAIETFDAIVLACSSTEAARLAADHVPAWAAQAAALAHEPIVTVLLRAPGARLPQPMLALDARDDEAALHEGRWAPAQFVFDLGQLRTEEPAASGGLAFVVSGAARAVEQGLEATGRAVLAQAIDQLGPSLPQAPTLLRALADKRATLLCTPGLQRPPAHIATGLVAAGDYIEGPYPSTLEGAVRSGVAAARLLATTLKPPVRSDRPAR